MSYFDDMRVISRAYAREQRRLHPIRYFIRNDLPLITIYGVLISILGLAAFGAYHLFM